MEKEQHPFLWNGTDLEQLRHIMDDPADRAVTAVYQSASPDYLRTLLKGMAENDSIVPDTLPTPMYNFMKEELEYPFSTGDIELFNQAHEIWKKKGTKFIFILFFRALPYTYMAEKPANVLRMTKLLESHTERRVFETAQFVFDVMDHRWWEPDKRGILTALKVRIMHAAMRHVILDPGKQGEKWNDSWGKPISQEDLIATNQVFSLEFFKGLEMLNDPLTAEEQKAWFHTWKTIGRIMGVQKELLTPTVEEAWELQHAVYNHLFRDETHSGIALAKALAETLHHFHLPRRLILLLMKRMLSDDKFPDCFVRMLGPSYRDEYPELFVIPETTEEIKQHEELLRQHFHTHLKEYYHTIREKRPEFKTSAKSGGLLRSIINWLKHLIGVKSKKTHLLDIHIGHLHAILHEKETGTPVEKLEEGAIIDSVTHLSGLMIGLLSFHFRKGKESGFRIPANLREHWQLHG